MLKRFLPYYKPYKFLFSLDMFCAFLLALADLVFPSATQYVVDVLVPSGNIPALFKFGLLLIVMYVCHATCQYIVSFYGHKLGVNIQRDMRHDIFKHIQTLDIDYFDNTKTGQIMSRIVSDLFEVGESCHHFPEDVLMASVRLIGSLVIMLSIEWRLTLIVSIIIPILAFFAFKFRDKFVSSFKRNKETLAAINEHIEESVSGVRVVKAFGNENFEQHSFDEGNKKFWLSRINTVRYLGIFECGISFCTNFGLVLVLIAGGFFAIKGAISLGVYIAFSLYVSRFFQPIQTLVRSMETFQDGAAGLRRFLEVMDAKPQILDKDNAVPLVSVAGDVEFRDVSFRYNDSLDCVLEHVNLHVLPGETVAIVGPSGAGKTTLCSLIPRFYDIDDGCILVDGLDIRQATIDTLRQAVGLVQQDVFLFSGTVRDNILYGKLNANEKELIEATKAANALDFVNSLPNGFDTIVGERGVKLSGGQKQRLAIARMFLKDPPILILDEATSSLDTISEAAIRESLDKLSNGRTTFIIAHRLATVKHAKRILVLTEEGIVEQGRHDDLVAKNGVYKKLYDAQVESLLVN